MLNLRTSQPVRGSCPLWPWPYVDFRPFPTRFVQKSSKKSTGPPGGGPFLVSLGCQITEPPQVGDHFWCP